jgi:hypothetical protein
MGLIKRMILTETVGDEIAVYHTDNVPFGKNILVAVPPFPGLSDVTLLRKSNLEGWVIRKDYFKDMFKRNPMWIEKDFLSCDSATITISGNIFVRILKMPANI